MSADDGSDHVSQNEVEEQGEDVDVVSGEDAGRSVQVHIVGVDEVEHALGQISWISPVARALLKAHVGDEVRVMTPTGGQLICIDAVDYE